MAWRGKLGAWDLNIHILLYIKQITSKGLLCSTGNSTWYSVITYGGEESEEVCWVCSFMHRGVSVEAKNVPER